MVHAVTPRLPAPLLGPEFGSYAADEVGWLLTDLSDVDLEARRAEREEADPGRRCALRGVAAHEYQPGRGVPRAVPRRCSPPPRPGWRTPWARSPNWCSRERGPDVVLASLARAGTPVGILMRRWAAGPTGSTCRTTPSRSSAAGASTGSRCATLPRTTTRPDVVFVDGWTGKGAIARELATPRSPSTADSRRAVRPDDLAVLADPGHCARTFGTRDDFLIASACLNSTVSGLVSRTVLTRA